MSGIPIMDNSGRRESERSESDRDDVLSTSKKRELHPVPEVEEGRDSKKRRIAPIPVSLGAESEIAIASTEEDTPSQTPVQQ